MSAHAVADVREAPPPEAEPELGSYASHDIELTEAQRWVDDEGVYVVRSTEFPFWGEGGNWSEALEEFGEALRVFYEHLAELTREGSATVDEVRAHAILTARLARVVEEHDRELARQRLWQVWRRAGRQHRKAWVRPSTLLSSKRHSSV